jgi:hypothetical protein
MPATGRRCASVRGDEGRGIIGSKPEEDWLAVQLAVAGLLVGRTAGNCPIQEPDRLKGTDCAPNPVFGQPQVRTVRERSPVNGECIHDPARCGVIARNEDREYAFSATPTNLPFYNICFREICM